jgi:hypothetical protein
MIKLGDRMDTINVAFVADSSGLIIEEIGLKKARKLKTIIITPTTS